MLLGDYVTGFWLIMWLGRELMSKESGRQDHEGSFELELGFWLKGGCLDHVLEQKRSKGKLEKSGRKAEEKWGESEMLKHIESFCD